VKLNPRFITAAEGNFYRVLRSVVGDRGHILAQVSMGQLLKADGKDRSANSSVRNKFAQKSLDFLICDPSTLRPILGIELDEASHARASRQTRDEVVDGLFEAAGLPLIRVLTSRSYDTRELEAVIGRYLGEA
jgi:hypothetical protein